MNRAKWDRDVCMHTLKKGHRLGRDWGEGQPAALDWAWEKTTPKSEPGWQEPVMSRSRAGHPADKMPGAGAWAWEYSPWPVCLDEGSAWEPQPRVAVCPAAASSASQVSGEIEPSIQTAQKGKGEAASTMAEIKERAAEKRGKQHGSRRGPKKQANRVSA